MPRKKHLPKKNLSYWVNKWLRKTRIGQYIEKERFQKPSKDIVFLTSEEVKASLAQVANSETAKHVPDSSPRPDPGILPQKNRLSGHHRKPKSINQKLKSIFNRISFGIFKKKHSSSAHHRYNRNISLEDVSISEAKSININELQKLNSSHGMQEHLSDPGYRHHHHRKQRQKNWFRKTLSRLKRNVKFPGKQKDVKLPSAFESNEELTNTQIQIPWTDYIKPTLTSTAMFMVAYQLTWFFYQLAVMVTASFFNINSVLFYYEVMFPEGGDSLKWTPETIIIITLAGPFLALIGWISLRYVLSLKNRYGTYFRMFLVWMYLISMMMFFGAFVGGAITLEGFGYVIDWLFMSIALRLTLSVLFITMIIGISWKVVSLMPETSRNHSWKNNRHKYILSRLVVPWILGACIMTLLKLTNNITQHVNIFDYDLINLATLVFAVVPPLLNSRTRPQLNRRRKVNQQLKAELPVIWVAAALITVLLFRFVLSYGIYFRFVLRLNLSFYN